MKSVDTRSAAELATREKDWGRAAGLWTNLFKETTDRSERWLAARRAAQAYRRDGRFREAAEILSTLLSERPGDKLALTEVARLQLQLDARDQKYWDRRKDFLYLHAVRQIATRIGSNANSILDIGSHGTPILDWFPDVSERYSVDLIRPFRAPGINSFKSDFLAWEPDRKFDLVLCLQVLEHIPEAARFAKRILEVAEVAIVSVPYLWRAGAKGHIHDPVDEEKLHSWFLRAPNFSYVVREISGERRIIAVYDRATTKEWTSVKQEDFLYRWNLKGAQEALSKALIQK